MKVLEGKRVLIGEPMVQSYQAAERLLELGCEVDFGPEMSDRKNGRGLEEMRQIVKEYDGFIGMSRKIPRAVLEQADRLCIIAKYGIGVDHIDLEAAREHGVLVAVSPVNRSSVAEHTIALMLALLKRLRYSQRYLNYGNWRCIELADRELSGKTVGFAGLGGHPREVIRRLDGWGCSFIGYDPYVSEEEAARSQVTKVDWDTLFQTADIVSLHLPLTKETEGIVGRRELEMMKDTALLINTARGRLVDQAELIRAVKEHQIAGLGTDVAQTEEPIPAYDPIMEIARYENVLITPHSAGWTLEAQQREVDLTIDAMVLALQGKEPAFIVDRGAIEGWKKKLEK